MAKQIPKGKQLDLVLGGLGTGYTMVLESLGRQKFIIKSVTPTKKRQDKEEITRPETGSTRFFILCSKLSCYTAIGAENRHHAANKATKLFGPNWTSLTSVDYLLRGYVFEEVPSFTQLLRGLAI